MVAGGASHGFWRSSTGPGALKRVAICLRPKGTAMQQRGRKSAAALAVAPIPRRNRPEPPDGLPATAAAYWRAIVSSLESDYFHASDLPLLRAYVVALAALDEARAALAEAGPVVGGKTSPWLTVAEKETRAVVALAARLRLAPQSRLDRTTAGPKARNAGGAAPWEFTHDPLLADPRN